MNKNLLIGIGIFLAVVLVGAYFIGKPIIKSGASQTPAPQASFSPSEPVKEFSVSASEYSFKPATLTAKSGENIRIKFTNNGAFSHNLTFKDLGFRTDSISPGDSAELNFVAPKPGIYDFSCTIDGHKDLGMEGKLIVE